jgi:hypothetical protein
VSPVPVVSGLLENRLNLSLGLLRGQLIVNNFEKVQAFMSTRCLLRKNSLKIKEVSSQNLEYQKSRLFTLFLRTISRLVYVLLSVVNKRRMTVLSSQIYAVYSIVALLK